MACVLVVARMCFVFSMKRGPCMGDCLVTLLRANNIFVRVTLTFCGGIHRSAPVSLDCILPMALYYVSIRVVGLRAMFHLSGFWSLAEQSLICVSCCSI